MRILLTLFFMIVFPMHAFAGMQSDHYHIQSSVLSGGGIHMASTGFQTETTLGQSSPLTGQGLTSEPYALYPGFWYTMEAIYGGPMSWLLLLLDDEQEMDLW